MKIEQRDLICIFIAGRQSADSTEAFLTIHGHSEPKLFIELHSRSHGVTGMDMAPKQSTEPASGQVFHIS